MFLSLGFWEANQMAQPVLVSIRLVVQLDKLEL